jgi:hypothetical protein
MKVKIGKNPAYFPVLSLYQTYDYRFSACFFNPQRPVTYPFHRKSGLEGIAEQIRNGTGSFHKVFLLDSGTGMGEPGGKITVIGKNDESRRKKIKATHVVEPFLYLPGQKIQRQRPVLRVPGTANITRWFVENKVMKTGFRIHGNTVQTNPVSRKNPGPRNAHNKPVNRNTTVGD